MELCIVCEEVEVEEEGEKCESCEEGSFFVGDGSLLHPDETEDEFWDHED